MIYELCGPGVQLADWWHPSHRAIFPNQNLLAISYNYAFYSFCDGTCDIIEDSAARDHSNDYS
jgi:hypothetical protein